MLMYCREKSELSLCKPGMRRKVLKLLVAWSPKPNHWKYGLTKELSSKELSKRAKALTLTTQRKMQNRHLQSTISDLWKSFNGNMWRMNGLIATSTNCSLSIARSNLESIVDRIGTQQGVEEAYKKLGFTDSATVEETREKTKLETRRKSSNSKERYTV